MFILTPQSRIWMLVVFLKKEIVPTSKFSMTFASFLIFLPTNYANFLIFSKVIQWLLPKAFQINLIQWPISMFRQQKRDISVILVFGWFSGFNWISGQDMHHVPRPKQRESHEEATVIAQEDSHKIEFVQRMWWILLTLVISDVILIAKSLGLLELNGNKNKIREC